MKKTRNMVYKRSDESKELLLCTINNGDIYRGDNTTNLPCHCKEAQG